ncbi:MAG: hypothetical protein C0391_07565 [Anaerolinea sp.]|nr:hypothetical protein [Anaerolinea sp.]
MKMIIAIVQDHDTEPVSRALTSMGFRVTQVASTGGFLRRGSSTLLIGLDDDQVEQALQIIRDTCSITADPNQKRATIFVLNVAKHLQL